jgi:hypothetical protein
MLKRSLVLPVALLAVVLALLVPLAALAQGRPASFDAALADLSRRLGRTITLADFDNSTSRWEWRGITFTDTTLECPAAGEAIVPAQVIGYQFIFILRNVRYDYRVALNDPNTLRLCQNPTGAIYELPPLPTVEARTEPPDEFRAALADLNERTGLNLTLEDFDNPRSRWSWRWREFQNSQLECPRAGQQTDQMITGGWQFIFVYNLATYDYRVPFNDPQGLFLCRAPANPPARIATATP